MVIRIFNCSVKEALKILEDSSFLVVDRISKRKVVKKEEREILEIGKIESLFLISYLKKRKIPISLAGKFLKEIYYSYKDKKFRVLGFKNES